MPSIVSTQNARFPATLLLAVQIEPQEIGRRLATARDDKGWTQMQFAIEASVSMSSVQRWESGKLPPVRELVRIAELLDIDADVLVTEPGAAMTEEEFRREVRERLEAIFEKVQRLEDRQEAEWPPQAETQRP
jgi:transcriptional regulator with XRE-family HTH domain